MSKGITFTDYKSAREYAWQKLDEGIHTTLYREKGKYIVYLGKKELKIDIKMRKKAMGLGIPVEYKEADTVPMVYNRILQEKLPPKRTSQDIKRMAKEELEKANLKEIELYVTKKLSLLRIAATNYPEKKGEKFQILFHPINKYTSDEHLMYIIKHEIEHIKEKLEEQN